MRYPDLTEVPGIVKSGAPIGGLPLLNIFLTPEKVY